MEENQNTSLFELSIDPISKSHLSSAAGWAKFLAIMGFIFCVLIVIIGIFAGTLLERVTSSRYESFGGGVNTRGFGALAAVMYVLFALLYFFPCLFLFNFATKMKMALISDDQSLLSSSFQNLKKTFRYIGILTIIILSFYVLILLFALIAGVGR